MQGSNSPCAPGWPDASASADLSCLSRRRLLGLVALGGAGLALGACLPTPGNQARPTVDPTTAWRGQTITLIVSETAGGGYDTWARLLARHLGHYLPGNPSIVVENVIGGGGRVAANRLYQAKPDGLSIGLLNRITPDHQLRGEGPDQGVRYDATRLTWLASAASETYVLYVHQRAGLTRADQLTTRPVKLGHQDVGGLPHTFELILRTVLGWPAGQRIFGWEGTSALFLGLERGDIDGGVGSWSSLVQRKGEELRQGTLLPLVRMGPPLDDPLLAGVPSADELFASRGDEDRQLLALTRRPLEYSRPFAAPPDLDPALTAALRAAFSQALADPTLLAEAAQLELEVSPLPGDRVQALVAEQLATPRGLVERLRALIEADTPR